jgi:uncharacterized protein YcgI (DUF1989 family)
MAEQLTHTIPAGHGYALFVEEGQLLRVIDIEGGNACDFNAFVTPDYRERFSAGRTRPMTRIHPKVGDNLWSNPPYERPLFRIVEDTVGHNDILLARCSRLRYDEVGMFGHRNCQDNLSEAIAPYGLRPDDVHDAFNIFSATSIDDEGRIRIEHPEQKPGGFVELECLVSCLVALSACPANEKYGGINTPIGVEVRLASRRR